ncbi:hypothetical protein [Streptacidiphilus anmyonensis]|uniref:hypothetical protein n=1 Tax=Streptacidiphilus anmyonensis TaxID=405782 RepID=UPI000A612C92|nr:hypothetical protein [Streptacidiphilus anmyonensis]
MAPPDDGPAPPPEPEPHPPDRPEPQPGELEELRRRIAQLEARHVPAQREHHRMRATGSAVLIVLAAVLSLLAVVSVWARDQVTDTGRFVTTMAPLASDPQVQSALTTRVTNLVVQQIDVPSLVGQLSQAASQKGVPPKAANLIGSLSGPIGSGITSLVGTVVNKVVTSPAFATLWTNALRAAHASMVKALTGQGGGAVSLENNQVTIDLGPIIAQVKTQLENAGLGLVAKLPAVHPTFTVYESTSIGKYKSYLRLLDIVGNWLPVVAVLVAAAGVYLARDRRRALIGATVAIAVAMLVLGVALAVFRGYFLDQLPPGVNSGAAGAVYDALVHFLRVTVRAVGVLAVLVALGAFFVGPSRAATFVRAASSTGLGGVRQAAEQVGFRAGPVERFVRRFKHWIGVAILLIAALVFVFWDHPTGMVVFWFAFVVLMAFAVREFLAPGPGLAELRQKAPPGPGDPGGEGSPVRPPPAAS